VSISNTSGGNIRVITPNFGGSLFLTTLFASSLLSLLLSIRSSVRSSTDGGGGRTVATPSDVVGGISLVCRLEVWYGVLKPCVSWWKDAAINNSIDVDRCVTPILMA